ncbi:MAG: tRNA (guanine-N7)-methyltransferase [Bdellovibrio sp.]|nr:tRNA (guanine-N7)-methyltransferase [Bdellovibrio sp.]
MDYKDGRPKINLTRTLPRPNAYTIALETEFRDFAFNEERAPLNKGKWRSEVFHTPEDSPMDVEIGTGTGMHLADHAMKNLKRFIVGLELKYKPLIQTIRRAHLGGLRNSAVCRYHAFNLDLLFEKNEINNMYIHFPDPWTTPRKPKNRVVNRNILNWIYEMQRPGSFVEFKTDSREYFLWALDEIKETKYRTEFQTLDLHNSNSIYQNNNFRTTFENIFIRQKIEINYIRLIKD